MYFFTIKMKTKKKRIKNANEETVKYGIILQFAKKNPVI